MKIKICLLGDTTVGKTSLIRRSVENTFNEGYNPTIGAMTYRKKLIMKKPKLQRDINLDLTIWDITGQLSFRKILHPLYLKDSHGAVLVCDLTKMETLDNLYEWLDSLCSEWQMVPSVIIANKNDLIDNVKFGASEIEKIASKFTSPFVVTSAKTGDNVDNAFRTLGEKIIKNCYGKIM
jgi:small GTP-binding protein